MTISNKLRHVQSVISSAAGSLAHHYRRPSNMNRFVVWQEDAEDESFRANNRREELCLTGSIDAYTPNEFDTLVDSLDEALHGDSRIQAVIAAVDYEDATGLIHYTWTFWVA